MSNLLVIVIVILISLSESVSGEIVISHKLKKTPVFQTTNDVQLNDNIKPSKTLETVYYLVLSEPPEACVRPKEHPTLSKSNTYDTDERKKGKKTKTYKWILLIEDDECDIATKVSNAVRAGYSGVILRSSDVYTDTTEFQNLKYSGGLQFELYLLNPEEWELIKPFVYPKPYTCNLSKTAEKPGVVEQAIVYCYEAAEFIGYPVYVLLYSCWNKIEAVFCFIISTVYWTCMVILATFRGIFSLEILFGFGYLGLILSPLILFGIYGRSEDSDSYFWRRGGRTTYGNTNWEYSSRNYRYYYNSGSNYSSSNNNNNQHDASKSDSLEYYRRILEVSFPLTEEKVKTAFRKKALTCHPDKYQGVTETEKRQKHAQFIEISKAKDKLLEYL